MRYRQKAMSRALLCLLFVFSFSQMGCASKYGSQTTNVAHYPDCYQPINDLRKSEYRPQQTAAGGAVGGALLGALVGYLATGKAQGAVIGAATGAVAGGAAGGIYGSQQQKAEDERQLAQYNQQLDGNITETNKATAAAKVARQCYERQFTVAANEYKGGRLTKEQFNSRYIEVTSGLQEAATILGEVNSNNRQITADYNRAMQEETTRSASVQAQSSPGKTTKARSGGQSPQLAQMTQTSRKMEQSTKAGEEEERLLLERLAATHQQAKDLMS